MWIVTDTTAYNSNYISEIGVLDNKIVGTYKDNQPIDLGVYSDNKQALQEYREMLDALSDPNHSRVHWMF